METVQQTQFDLFLGYTAFFAIILCYVILLRTEQKKISRDLQEIRKATPQ